MLGLGTNLISNESTRQLGYNNTYSVSFDGTNEYIDTGNSFKTTIQKSHTFSLWMKTPTNAELDNSAVIFGTNDTLTDNGFQLYNKAGKLAYTFYANTDGSRQIDSSTTWTQATGDGDGTDNVWWHLVIVSNKGSGGGAGSTVIYKNGTVLTTSNEIGTITGTNQGNYENDNNLYIGSVNNATTRASAIESYIDEFALWDVALDAAAVASISYYGKDLLEDNGGYSSAEDLVAYYRLNEGSGTTATDAIETSHGTLTNGPSYVTDAP
jgi:hypothetical protein